MPQTALTNLGINYGWDAGADGWKAGMDRNLILADVLTQANVATKGTTTPPGAPAAGDRYLIPPSGATGAWAGQGNKIAVWDSVNSAWVFIAPLGGWRIWVSDEALVYLYQSSTGWFPVAGQWAINTQTGTSYTLVKEDAGKVVRMNNAAANTVTVPPNSSVGFPLGTRIPVRQVGAGTTSLVAGSGVTLNGTLALPGQNREVFVHKVGTDTWDVGP